MGEVGFLYFCFSKTFFYSISVRRGKDSVVEWMVLEWLSAFIVLPCVHPDVDIGQYRS